MLLKKDIPHNTWKIEDAKYGGVITQPQTDSQIHHLHLQTQVKQTHQIAIPINTIKTRNELEPIMSVSIADQGLLPSTILGNWKQLGWMCQLF